MIVENAAAGKKAPVLSVNSGCPVTINLCDAIWVPGMEGRRFGLRRLSSVPEYLAAGRLDKPDAGINLANGVEHAYNG